MSWPEAFATVVGMIVWGWVMVALVAPEALPCRRRRRDR